jgi:hypothetical protein
MVLQVIRTVARSRLTGIDGRRAPSYPVKPSRLPAAGRGVTDSVPSAAEIVKQAGRAQWLMGTMIA